MGNNNNKVFTITEQQLNELLFKVENKITTILRKEGVSSKTIALSDSVSDTIKTFLNKTNSSECVIIPSKTLIDWLNGIDSMEYSLNQKLYVNDYIREFFKETEAKYKI